MEENNKKTVDVETYAEDMAKIVGDNASGVVKKMIEEQEEYDTEAQKNSSENKKNKTFLLVGIILVALAFLAVSLVFFFRIKIFTVPVTPQYVPIVFTDKTEFKEIADLNKEKIFNTVLNETNATNLKSGGIEGIYLTKNKKVLGFRDFLVEIGASLDRTKIDFLNDNFLIGITNKEAKNPFILLQIRSIADIFEPMKAWENKMFYDLHGLFGIDLNADTKYLLEQSFEDGIVQNKNARILYDKDGAIVMMYVYTTESSVVITNSSDAVHEVMLRLASGDVRK